MSLASFFVESLAAIPAEQRAPLAALIPPPGFLDRYDPAVRDRGYIEYVVSQKCVTDLIAAGYRIEVDDGAGVLVWHHTPAAILDALFAVDDPHLTVFRDSTHIGWVSFVFGNDGWDCISDYSTSLEDVLVPVNALADRLGA